jgi:signal transduction histidine kinase
MHTSVISKYSVFDQLDIGVLVLEQDSQKEIEYAVTYVNNRVTRYTDILIDPEAPPSIRELFPKVYEYKLHHQFQNCLDKQERIDLGEVMFGDTNRGHQYLDISLVPLSSNTLIVYYHNVSHYVEKINSLEVKNKELTHFAHVISHDLVEPINTIKGYIDLMFNIPSAVQEAKSQKYLQIISNSALRMKTLVTGLLEFSKLNQAQEWEKVSISELIRDVIEDLSTIIQKRDARIYVALMPEIVGSSIQLQGLFQNLITNSLKFQHPEVPPRIEIGHINEIDHWHFFVRDNGIGIDPKDQERVFLMFEKLHGKHKFNGAGIGLAHCHKIVNLHQGEIWVESELGKGTTFHFRIPKELR